MLQLSLSHSQKRGAFCSSADVAIAYRYWVKHPVLLDSRPADCVTTSASNTGCFVMTAKDGKPCRKCGGSKWYKNGKCAACEKNAQHKRYHDDPERHRAWAREHRRQNPEKTRAISKKSYHKHKDKHQQIQRTWRRNNPEKAKAATQNWRQNNQDRLLESQRNRRQENREQTNEWNRNWKKQNPEKIKALNHRRDTRKTKAGGSYTASEWKALVDHYEGKCLCCGRSDVALTVDHVIPVAKGGTSNIENLQPLCLSCNASKRDKTIDYRPGKGLGRWVQRKLFG